MFGCYTFFVNFHKCHLNQCLKHFFQLCTIFVSVKGMNFYTWNNSNYQIALFCVILQYVAQVPPQFQCLLMQVTFAIR